LAIVLLLAAAGSYFGDTTKRMVSLLNGGDCIASASTRFAKSIEIGPGPSTASGTSLSALTSALDASRVAVEALSRTYTFSPCPTLKRQARGTSGDCQPASFRMRIRDLAKPFLSSATDGEPIGTPFSWPMIPMYRTSIFRPVNGLKESTSTRRGSPTSRFALGPCKRSSFCSLRLSVFNCSCSRRASAACFRAVPASWLSVAYSPSLKVCKWREKTNIAPSASSSPAIPITTSSSNVASDARSSLGNYLYSPSAPTVKTAPNTSNNTSDMSKAVVVADLDSIGQVQIDSNKYPISPYDLCVGLAFSIQGIAVLGIGISEFRRKYKLAHRPNQGDKKIT